MSSVPSPSIVELVTDAMIARAQSITKFGGFNTDAGKTMVIGERRQIGEADPDSVLALFVDDDERVTWQAGKVFYRIPYRFKVITRSGPESWRSTARLEQDVKRAIELEDTLLAGLLEHPGIERGPVKRLEREAGATDVGVEITYFAPIQESWGNP